MRQVFLHLGPEEGSRAGQVPALQIREMEHAAPHGHLQEMRVHVELPQRHSQEVPPVRVPPVGRAAQGQPLPQMREHLDLQIHGGAPQVPEMLLHGVVPRHTPDREAQEGRRGRRAC